MSAIARSVLDRSPQVPPPQSWMGGAACADPDLDPAFRAVFTTDDPTDLDPAARALCAGCRVVTDCEIYARGVRHIAGIWGGHRRGLPGRPTHRSPAEPTGSDR